ncbi:heterokaryon incompatibility protein-domain-containing protein [Xylaria flabelliformis]|nr:heterokaryon incompatibility protein-domain-containing protein [Xylaria flabelliformis]
MRVTDPTMNFFSNNIPKPIRPREATENLCSRCADSVRAVLSLIESDFSYPWWKELEHHGTIAKLEASAEIENCAICRIVVSIYPEGEIETLPNGRDSRLCTRIGWFDRSYTCWVLQIAATNGKRPISNGAILYLSLSTTPGNSPVPSPFTGNPETLRLAKSWFTECCESHDACQPADTRTYPKWIISIYQGLPIRLVSGSMLQLNHCPYATLSHCWGTACPLTLTAGSLGNLLSEIPEARLPKTFRDAINIARSFGLKYLWIDSLCITQDDLDEWQRESMKMADIYQGSTLNIAATGAEDGSVGLHFARDSRAIQKIEGVSIPLQSDTIAEEFFLNVFAGDIYRAGIENSPLVSRGWCLQERFLAPRTLHFAKSQIFWECQKKKRCETFPNEIPYMYRTSNLRPNVANVFAHYLDRTQALRSLIYRGNEFQLPESYRLERRYGRHLFPQSLAEIWAQCVSMYSRTKLTIQSDKLVAISGVARWIHWQTAHSENMNVYLAGLWRENLQSQLLWRVVVPGKNTQPTQYLAPSWSWASTNQPVEYRAASNVDDTNNPSCELTALIDIVEAETELLAKHDNFGQVTGGTLQIEFKVIFSLNTQDWKPGDNVSQRIYWDYDIGKDQTVYLLPVLDFSNTDGIYRHSEEGLVLKEVSDTSATPHFTRLGIFFTWGFIAKIGNKVEDLSRFETRVNGKTCYQLSII